MVDTASDQIELLECQGWILRTNQLRDPCDHSYSLINL